MALESVRNILSVPELRKRIGWTLLLLFVFRLGSFIPLPGVNLEAFRQMMEQAQQGTAGRVLGFASALSGGVIDRFSIFYMGIMPYISASIIFQILTKVIPALEKVSKEGEVGRKRINKWTRYATVGVALIQGLMHAYYLKRIDTGEASFIHDATFAGFILPTVLSMTAGTLFLMWLGEQITEYGVGNGISLIIMAGIVARAPQVIADVSENFANHVFGWGTILTLVALYVFMVVAIVTVTQAQRRIPMQSARQIRGRLVVGGQRNYFPLKLNAAGVIPVIFASALLTFPAGLIQWVCEMNGWKENWIYRTLPGILTSENGVVYMVLYSGLIFAFTYFYTAIAFNPVDLADNLKQNGAFIPGIRPGRNTAEFIERVMNRVTFAGAAFLAFIAIVPILVHMQLNVGQMVASFLGGTGLLIVVGVGLDLVQKIESHLILRQYKGFLGGGTAMRGR
jgi:preprotein translocase subunit SecY